MITQEKIIEALKVADFSWFTTPLVGELSRYVVAFTHNENVSHSKLEEQANLYAKQFENINIWGWEDIKTWITYIDISTSFDNLDIALSIAKQYNQIAIWDNLEFKEIRL